jgi:hypothetical protein
MAKLKDPFWQCRVGGLRHSWDDEVPLPPYARTEVMRNAVFSRCVRCGTEKVVSLDSYGEVASVVYHHPEGYKLPPEQMLTPGDVRLERLKRQHRFHRNGS